MALTPEEREIGKQNFQDAVGVSRRAFLKTAATAPALGAFYFGYQELHGKPVKTGFIGTGDEGAILMTQHPADYMEIVGIADLRPSNLKRALYGDGNEHRIGLIKKLGHKTATGIKQYADHRELLNDPEIEAVVIAVPLNVHARLTIEALEAGKHVLCEKLMAHNITECKDMIRAAKKAERLLAIGHSGTTASSTTTPTIWSSKACWATSSSSARRGTAITVFPTPTVGSNAFPETIKRSKAASANTASIRSNSSSTGGCTIRRAGA